MVFPVIAALGGSKVASALIGGAATLGASALAARGQAKANQANAALAQRQMDFQERMSGSSWQRGMEDMQAAGMNPILAYQKGGASTPAGATAQMASVEGAGVNSALQTAHTAATIENLLEQNKQIQAQEQLTRDQSSKTLHEIGLVNEQKRRLHLENSAYSTLSDPMRAVVLSGSGMSSAAAAASAVPKAVQSTIRAFRR